MLISEEFEPGYDFLKDNKTIVDIVAMLSVEADAEESDRSKRDNLFSKENLLRTLSREYFTIVGTLSSEPRGLQLMLRHSMWHKLQQLAFLPDRVDLTRLILTSLDHNMASEARAILERAVVFENLVVRFVATRHLMTLLRAGSMQLRKVRTGVAVGLPDFAAWGVDVLVRLLDDSDAKVAQLALSILDEACDTTSALDKLIELNPSSLHRLGKHGKHLVLRFLSRPSGFTSLGRSWTKSEMRECLRSGNASYVLAAEAAMVESLSPQLWRASSPATDKSVTLPPHFFGELAKTAEGVALIRSRGAWTTLVEQLRAAEKSDAAIGAEQRGAIMALGQIGQSSSGFTLFERNDALELMVRITERSPSLSLRGAGFCALGLIAFSQQGHAALEQLGWRARSGDTFVVTPSSQTFFRVALTETRILAAETPSQRTLTPAEEDVYNMVVSLMNPVQAENSEKALKKCVRRALFFLLTFAECEVAILKYSLRRACSTVSSRFLLRILSLSVFSVFATRYSSNR